MQPRPVLLIRNQLGPVEDGSNSRLALLSEVNYITLQIRTTNMAPLSGVTYSINRRAINLSFKFD